MVRLLVRRLFGFDAVRGSFRGRVLLLSAGTAGAQALLVVAAPLLTRLYDPAAFGVLGVFAGTSAMLAMIVTGRFEYAIPVVRTNGEAANLLALCCAAALVTAAFVSLALALLEGHLAGLLGPGESATVFWLLVPQCLLVALASALEFWSLRRQLIGEAAVASALRAVGQVSLQTVAAIIPAGRTVLGQLGLVVGYVGGEAFRVTWFLWCSRKELERLRRLIGLRRMCAIAQRHWRYPILYGPANLMQSGSRMLPPILIAFFYGPSIAGYYALADRVIYLPLQMVGRSTSRVVLIEAAGQSSSQQRNLLGSVSWHSFVILSLVFSPVVFFGNQLFDIVFGEGWALSGDIARWIVPVSLVRFITLSVSQLVVLRDRHGVVTFWSACTLAVMVAAFIVGGYAGLHPVSTIAFYAAAASAVQVGFLIHTFRIISQTR